MPNKQQRNAFYFFMIELADKLKKEGRVFANGLQDVAAIAHPRYQMLTPAEKEVYENQAKEHKRRQRGQNADSIRMDNQGNIIAKRVDHVSAYENERTQELQRLRAKWPADILDEKFHFIDVQSLCKTDEGGYLPVEIAIAQYSLREGILRLYHQFLVPPEIPKGMRYTCKSTSESTHKIPVEGHPDGTNNYLSVLNSLENFVNPGAKLPYYPPFFALREDFDKVDFTLEFIHAHACLGGAKQKIRVYELESLFTALVEHSNKMGAPSKALATEMLTSNVHDFHENLKCKFHEELECRYCSLLIVKKFCYAISDALTGCYDYELIPHRHLPAESNNSRVTVLHPESSTLSPIRTGGPSGFFAQPSAFRQPANIPKTQSQLLQRMAKPAPVLRPPGAADLDFRKNQRDIVPRMPGAPQCTRPPAPVAIPAAEPGASQSSSKNTSLVQGRHATWVPTSSSWTRTSTPASTPRATPLPTPLQTPLPTPLQTPSSSPPRPGAMFSHGSTSESGHLSTVRSPNSDSWISHLNPPPGLRTFMAGVRPPPGFPTAAPPDYPCSSPLGVTDTSSFLNFTHPPTWHRDQAMSRLSDQFGAAVLSDNFESDYSSHGVATANAGDDWSTVPKKGPVGRGRAR